jgi:antitoxin component HigA of HigAB toxin-antitoxin module
MGYDILCLAIDKNFKIREIDVNFPRKSQSNCSIYKLICKNLDSNNERYYCETVRKELEKREILSYQETENIKYKVPEYLIERANFLLEKINRNNNDLQTIFHSNMKVDYTIKTKKELRDIYIEKFIYNTDISFDFKSRLTELLNELNDDDYCVIYESHV